MIRVLLAEDMHMVRGALVALLDLEPGIEVVCEVSSGDEIVAMAERHCPDVAVVDIDLPVLDGLSAVVDLTARMPTVRTLMLTSLGRPGTLRKALAARVDGFILKDAPPSQLANAIRDVAAGTRVFDPQLTLAAIDRGECPLTDRELDVLRLAATGADATQVAADLALSTGTVRNYLTSGIAKVGGRNRVDAIRIAAEAGWL